MEFIAYNTSLDVKTLIKNKIEHQEFVKEQDRRIFEANKRKLLPYILKYAHYIVELNNNIQYNECYYGQQYMRPFSLRGDKLVLDEVIKVFTADYNFSKKGSLWSCNLITLIKTEVNHPTIWLNTSFNHVYNKNMEYSMTGFIGKQYCNSIEDYIQDATEYIIKNYSIRK